VFATVRIPYELPEDFDDSQTPPAQPASSSTPHRLFSFRSFLAEQTITIVSSLGAFFILIGALGFIATTTNLFLAFLVTFLVHALFAVTGTVFNRLASFRLVARIYLAIFALLVPLVGFSAYRLVSGHLLHISSPTLVAVAATYAALVYALLAVTQQFRPFSYMAATAFFTANLALAYAFHLDIWWWPCLLMPLAFTSLISLPTLAPHFFTGNNKILREAVQELLVACLIALVVGIFATFSYSQVSGEVRMPLSVMLLLLFTWTSAFLLLTRAFNWLPVLAYELLASVLAFAYAFSLGSTGYVLTFTGLAITYHSVTLIMHRNTTLDIVFKQFSLHLDSIALILCSLIPFIVAPYLPLNLLFQAYRSGLSYAPFSMTMPFMLELISLALGTLLTISVSINRVHSKTQIIQREWRWLLLLSGLLFTSLCGIEALLLHLSPFQCFLALTLIFMVATIVLRRIHSSLWADVLDVITLCEATCTIILSVGQSQITILTLLLAFAALSFSIVLYQRRSKLLFLPLIFTLLALPLLWLRPVVILSMSVLLPFVAVIIYLLFTKQEQAITSSKHKIRWEWPLLTISVFYGAMLCWHDALSPFSALRLLTHLPLSTSIDIAFLAIIWYICAALTRIKWELLFTIGFSLIALLMPANSFWTLAILAPIFALLAVGINRIFGRDWAIPCYVVALFSEIVIGASVYNGKEPFSVVMWILLGFAALIYIIGAIEDNLMLLWAGALFASWSLLDSIYSGDVIRPTLIAILFVAFALSIRKSSLLQLQRLTALRFSLPIYSTAFVATLFVAGYGLFINPDTPFYAATPCLFLLYALIIYGVALVENWVHWLWAVAAYAIGGILLIVNTTACVFTTGVSQLGLAGCNDQIHVTVYLFWGVALLAGILGLITTRIISLRTSSQMAFKSFTWSWPWYITSLITIIVASVWSRNIDIYGTGLLSARLEYAMLLSFIVLAFVIMLVEQKPAILLLITALAVWMLMRTQWSLWQVTIAFNALFVLVFASHWLWHSLPAQQRMVASRLHSLLALCGQGCLILFIILNNVFFASTGQLAHMGASSLLVLAVLLYWYSQLDETAQHIHVWCTYIAGLLMSLVVTWELSALGQTHLDLLTLAPATYLVIIAPFLSRDECIAHHHIIGQCCSLLGSATLLLPALWFSFNQSNLQPTLILAGESLTLLLMGVGTRIRIFVLSGASLVIVSALHALFLPSLGIPSSLALTILGSILLILATALSIARHRVQAMWTLME